MARIACIVALAGCQRGSGCGASTRHGDLDLGPSSRWDGTDAGPDASQNPQADAQVPGCDGGSLDLGGPDELAALLGRPMLSSSAAFDSIQRYVLARLPALPKLVDTATAQADAAALRQRLLDEIVFRGVPSSWREAPLDVEWLDEIAGGPGYHIRKLRYQALPGMWIPALLYVPDDLPDAARVPVVVNYSGHWTTGKVTPHQQIPSINQAKRGMLALSIEWFGMGQLNTPGYSHDLEHHLNLTGLSGLGAFYLAADRAIDVALSLANADPERIAVAGVSGGGWQSITVGALDPRVSVVNSIAGFSDLRSRVLYPADLGDGEQMVPDFSTIADYTHLVRMVAPRWQLLIYNAKDNCCFRADHALTPMLQAGDPLYALFGQPGRLRSYINEVPGTHNFETDNRQQHYRLLGDAFYPGDTAYSAVEIDSQSELKTAAQLSVPLPSDNLDLLGLAAAQAQAEPLELPPTDPDELDAWRQDARVRLAYLVRAPSFIADPSELTQAQSCDGSSAVQVHWWKLAMGSSWQVPAIEFVPTAPGSTGRTGVGNEGGGDASTEAGATDDDAGTKRDGAADGHDGGDGAADGGASDGGAEEQTGPLLVIADGGRAAAASVVDRALQAGRRVAVMDPVLYGELRPKYLEGDARLIATVGGRSLGLQAAQVIAAARWLGGRAGGQPVTLVAIGMRSSLTALVAAALEEGAIGAVETHAALTSLQELIERRVQYASAPEMFCFGLLHDFDVPGLRALVAPRPMVVE